MEDLNLTLIWDKGAADKSYFSCIYTPTYTVLCPGLIGVVVTLGCGEFCGALRDMNQAANINYSKESDPLKKICVYLIITTH